MALVQISRRRPYLDSDFMQASERIRAGLIGLAQRIASDASLPEGISMAGQAGGEGRTPGGRNQRRACRQLQRDLLDATAFLAALASGEIRCEGENPQIAPEIEEKLRETHQRGASLILRLQRAGLQLTFSRKRGERSTLEAGRQYLELGKDCLELLCARHPELTKEDGMREFDAGDSAVVESV